MFSNRAARRGRLAAAVVLGTSLLLTACGGSGDASQAASGDGTGTIDVWGHTGTDAEVAAIQAAVDGFNSSQSEVQAKLRLIPGDTYTQTIQNTPADQMPDVLDIDGPLMASFAYNQKIAPISDFVSKDTIDNATEGSIAEGTIDDNLYALAQFDSAMGLYGNKAILEQAGVTIPTSFDTAWTAEQFSDALAKIAAVTPGGKAIDISESGLSGEWGIYAFSPLVVSGGGSIITDGKASGVLDSAENVKTMQSVASWKQYVDSSADGQAFPTGQVGLQLGGHWLYPDDSKALGDDLVALPLPNMGQGAKADAGSWTWGIGSSTENGKAAGAFLDYLLNDENVKAMTDANGAPPATKSAFAGATAYQSDGPLALWGEQLSKACAADAVTADCLAVYRPVTAGYPTVTAEFGKALSAIYGGADAQSTLTAAAQAIDSNYADNNGYK